MDVISLVSDTAIVRAFQQFEKEGILACIIP